MDNLDLLRIKEIAYRKNTQDKLNSFRQQT